MFFFGEGGGIFFVFFLNGIYLGRGKMEKEKEKVKVKVKEMIKLNQYNRLARIV